MWDPGTRLSGPSKVRELAKDLLHPLHVQFRDVFMVAHRSWVVLANDALSGFLNSFRSGPGLVNVAGGEIFQHRQISSDEVSIGICLPAELDWAVAVEKLLEKRRARKPHPRASID